MEGGILYREKNKKQGFADFPNQIPHYVNIMSSIHTLRIPTGRRIPEKTDNAYFRYLQQPAVG